MKFFRCLLFFGILISSLQSCEKEYSQRWNVQPKDVQQVSVIDISKEFYDPKIDFKEFKGNYDWFLSTNVSDEIYQKKRTDTLEINIYNQAIKVNNIEKLQKNLANLFGQIRAYYPEFQDPKVFVFSSATELYTDPILFVPQENFLFIDLSAFLGEKNEYYKGIDQYIRSTMNPDDLIPRVSMIFAESFCGNPPTQGKFIDQLVYNGKVMVLQDAFLSNISDAKKISYTQKQEEWAKANEFNVWNYFVENDLIFSDDPKLVERFISPGPFSKFYTEIDNKSSPKIGVWIGRQICRKYLIENNKISLNDFLSMNATEIFNESRYNPKN